jgi:hypothetical protein
MRFSAAFQALNGFPPTKNDSRSVDAFRIWTIGYMAGVQDSEAKRKQP